MRSKTCFDAAISQSQITEKRRPRVSFEIPVPVSLSAKFGDPIFCSSKVPIIGPIIRTREIKKLAVARLIIEGVYSYIHTIMLSKEISNVEDEYMNTPQVSNCLQAH